MPTQKKPRQSMTGLEWENRNHAGVESRLTKLLLKPIERCSVNVTVVCDHPSQFKL
jgi:hypothetical protein